MGESLIKNKKKTAIITGASRGIGREIAKRLASEGYSLLLNYNQSEKQCLELADEIVKEHTSKVEVAVFKADVSLADEVSAMVGYALKVFGRIDVLICNSGINLQKLFTETTEEEWQKVMDINLSGAFYCCKNTVPHMVSEKAGKIILVSSVWGMVGASCEVAYSVSKAGLIGLTKALAKELAPSNIQVNCVAPGVIDTEMNSSLNEEDLKNLEDEIPSGRLGSAGEIAGTVAFLLSKDADYITGQVISPNGGFVI